MQEGKLVTLGLDSSGPTLLLALSDGEKTVSLYHTALKQEQFLQPLLQRALAKTGYDMADIRRIFLVRGPGRFTGIRISLTFASMMQALNGAQVLGATLFEVLHEQVKQSLAFMRWQQENPQGLIAVVLHAFREEYFLQFFDGTASAPQWLDKDQLREQLAARTEPLFVAGMDKDGASLAALLGDYYRLAPMADSHVRAQTLLDMAQDPRYIQNALEPLYLKPARFELTA